MISTRALSLLLPIACCLAQPLVFGQTAAAPATTTGGNVAAVAAPKTLDGANSAATTRKFQPLPWQSKNDTTFGITSTAGQAPSFLQRVVPPSSAVDAAPAENANDKQALPLTGPYETSFFGGLTPADPDSIGPLHQKLDLTKSPEWANDKIKMRYFQDNKEHFGDSDPGGFF